MRQNEAKAENEAKIRQNEVETNDKVKLPNFLAEATKLNLGCSR